MAISSHMVNVAQTFSVLQMRNMALKRTFRTIYKVGRFTYTLPLKG